MSDPLDVLLGKMQQLEKQLNIRLQQQELEYDFQIRMRQVHFSSEAKAQHKSLIKRFSQYVLDSTFLTLLSTPIIWGCLIPIAILDLTGIIYQATCFPIYGIPKVRRRDYVALDRHRLSYLNTIEKLNCDYCGYANGVLGYFSEIAARTEQYWCPIKHALRVKTVHSRYRNFFDYGDAEGYRRRIEEVRRAFQDLEVSPS
jgi:hypothetical protein